MKNFIAIDFETATGKRYSACAIGIVKVENNSIVEQFSTLIQPPGNEYNPHNINVHGITPEMTENIPTFDKIYERIKSYIDGKCVIAHNASFDIDVLYQTMEYYGIVRDDLNITSECTMGMYDHRKLDDICNEKGILMDHHDPLSDARACAKIYLLSEGITIKRKKETIKRPFRQPTDGRQTITGDVLKPDMENVENKENPFFGKKVVVSGTYITWPDRTKLAKLLKGLGADIDTSVSGRTNYLIAGSGVGPSKLKKMEKNIADGKDAHILDEELLLSLLPS